MNRRFRKALVQTRGLQVAGLIFVLGVAFFILGSALILKLAIEPLLSSVSMFSRHFFERFLPKSQIEIASHILGGVFTLFGLYLLYLSVRTIFQHLIKTLNPEISDHELGRVYLRRQKLAQGPKIVAIGGGTGLSTLLRGLKTHTSNITAIVTVTDDGGSSGKLRKEKNMIPPGDIRNCLVALADAEKAMTDLFQFRFKNDSGALSGHSMGNLLIAGLVDQSRGDFEQAVELASTVLSIRGRVMPSTLSRVGLRAILDNGREVCGESAIVEANGTIRRVFLDPPDVQANASALKAIEEADLICIGPGSIYTSVIPPLLVPSMSAQIRRSKAAKVYICNVMTQPGESEGFTASQHVTAINLNVEEKVFDYVMVNNGLPSSILLQKYKDAGQNLVEPDVDRIRALGIKVIQGNFMNESEVVRHDPMRLAQRIMELVGK